MKAVLQRSRKNSLQQWWAGQSHHEGIRGRSATSLCLDPKPGPRNSSLPACCLHSLQTPVFTSQAQGNHSHWDPYPRTWIWNHSWMKLWEEYYGDKTSTEVKGPFLFSRSRNAAQQMPPSPTFPVNGTTQMPHEKLQSLFWFLPLSLLTHPIIHQRLSILPQNLFLIPSSLSFNTSNQPPKLSVSF